MGIEFDDEIACNVCFALDGEDGNEMIFCDACDVCVHQACYGVQSIPEGDWLCRTCATGLCVLGCVCAPSLVPFCLSPFDSISLLPSSFLSLFFPRCFACEILYRLNGHMNPLFLAVTGVQPQCVLCPKKGGAMKSTRSGSSWAHVACALWVPEVSIGDPEKMEPITNISQIPSQRWGLLCSVCK